MSTVPTTDSVWRGLGADLAQFIRRRVKDEHAAADLLQETFVRIHRRLNTLADDERLAPWVYQIARNVITDYFRRQATLALAAEDEVPAKEAEPGKIPCLTAGWIAELIGELPETYRQAVRLAEVEELSHQEVADQLGISLAAAKQRVQRGRQQLRQVLDRCCTFERDRRGNVFDYQPRPDRTVCRDCGEL